MSSTTTTTTNSSSWSSIHLLKFVFAGCVLCLVYALFVLRGQLLTQNFDSLLSGQIMSLAAANTNIDAPPHQGAGAAAVVVSGDHRQPFDTWKLWHDMNPTEQTESFKRLKPYVKKYGDMYNKGRIVKHGTCNNTEFRTGHSLCHPAPPKPCSFFSFGINDDPSFDTGLADAWGCRGFAADPTVHHPSKLHPLVTFHNIGLKMLEANEERQINKGGEVEWWEMSITGVFKALGLKHLDVLKIDCEGCEVAFTRDILLEDRYFLEKVDQISLETHTSKAWINSTEAAYYFGLLFPLLEEAGFVLEWTHRCGCSKRHEILGCQPEITEMGFPCGYDPWPGKTKVVMGRSCQDSLWKRYPKGGNVEQSTT